LHGQHLGGRRAGAGAKPGNNNQLRSGVRSHALAPLIRAAGPDGGDLIAATARHALAAAAVHGDPADTLVPAADFDRLAQRLRAFWADDTERYERLVAALRQRRARRSPGGWHFIGHTWATSGGGAPPGSSNAMRHGRYSARLAPLMHALGSQSRSVVEQAITRALEDALTQATFRFVRHQRIEARTRVLARDFAWGKVITLLKDAGWYPADIIDPLPDALAAQRHRHAEDATGAVELRRILDPVFNGTPRDALTMPPSVRSEQILLPLSR
jgi:hypothetical protein